MEKNKVAFLRKLTPKRQKGNQAEDSALDYLKKRGLTLLERNFTTKAGEVDLIMRESSDQDDTLVFIEVRYRKTKDFGGAAASITTKKQQRIIKAALAYQQKYYPQASMRFDVVAIEGEAMQTNWIISAFDGF